MRNDAIAWGALPLLAAYSKVGVSQTHFNLRSCHTGQFHADGYIVFRLAKVNGRRPPCARHRNFRLSRFLQRSIKPPDAIPQTLKLDSFQPDVSSFNHLLVNSEE